jgi:hypothetical protein
MHYRISFTFTQSTTIFVQKNHAFTKDSNFPFRFKEFIISLAIYDIIIKFHSFLGRCATLRVSNCFESVVAS